MGTVSASVRRVQLLARAGIRRTRRTSGRIGARLTGRSATRHQEHPSAPEHLANYLELVNARRPRTLMALISESDRGLTGVVDACRRGFPGATLLVVRLGPGDVDLPMDEDGLHYSGVAGDDDLYVHAWQLEPVDAILDFTDQSVTRGGPLVNTLFALPEHSLYVIHHLEDDSALRRMLAADEFRGLAAADLARCAQSLVIDKRGTHVYKLRDQNLSGPDFDRRLAPSWGRTLLRRKPLRFESRASIETNRPELAVRFRPTMDVEARYLREYRNVVCHPRQEVVRANLALPISFRHPNRAVQETKSGVPVSADVDYIRQGFPPPVETLTGHYFHLISAFPSHFGHFMTEDIGRFWGWREAKAHYPDCKLLISYDPELNGIPGWQLILLDALQVNRSDVVAVKDPVRVERLLGASPQFHHRRFVDPALGELWDELRDRLAPRPDPANPRRIFITRPPGGVRQRRCLNAAAVEQRAVDAGFTLVRPETLGIPEQVSLFSDADVVAGWGGAGMFGTVYARRPGRRVVISSDQYTAVNEFMIAAVKGDDYVHLWGDAEVRHPPGERSEEAFWSDFTFDFDRDGAMLDRALLDLEPWDQAPADRAPADRAPADRARP